MPEERRAIKGLIRRFLDLSTDSLPKTIFVAVAVCLVASMLVSALAVSLRPLQEANKLRDKQRNILQVAGLYEPGIDVLEAFEVFEPHVLSWFFSSERIPIPGQREGAKDRKSTRLNSSHSDRSRMPSSA